MNYGQHLQPGSSMIWIRKVAADLIEHTSFIHSGYFYSASSSSQLLRGAPDTAQILCRSFALKRYTQLCEGLAQGPYVVAREGFEPVNLWTKGIGSTNQPPCPV